MGRRVQWSKDRPKKPAVDPLLEGMIRMLNRDKRSMFAKANVSGLAPATMNKWLRGETKRPQAVSLQMAARMLGCELKFVKTRK